MKLFCQRFRKFCTSCALALSQLPQMPVSGPRVIYPPYGKSLQKLVYKLFIR